MGQPLNATAPTTVIDWPDLDDEETKKKVKKKVNTGWNVHVKDD